MHAPTEAHPEIVARLLEAGVPTYVDKPLAYEFEDSRRLVELAEERGVSSPWASTGATHPGTRSASTTRAS